MGTVVLQRINSAAHISFNRPETRNAIDEPTAREFLACIEEADEDSTVRAVVIGGAGAFCSGVDICVLDQVGEGRAWSGLEQLITTLFNPIARKLFNMRKPTIARIEGVAAGAGMSFALACDFRFGSRSGRFVPAFSKLGLIPDCGGTWLMPRILGPAKALEVAAFSSAINAEEAKRLGLLTWLSFSEDVSFELEQHIGEVVALPRLAFVAMRRLFASGGGSFDEALQGELEAMRRLGTSTDYAEGIRAFRERRAPRFSC